MSDEVRSPTQEDFEWLKQAEMHILNLLRDRYSSAVFEHTESDLKLCQRLLDDKDKMVRREHTLELQCLGVVLGNVFVTNTSMRWARVINEYGDMLALHSQRIEFTLYPLSMISKRVEEQRIVDMPALYRSLVADLGLA